MENIPVEVPAELHLLAHPFYRAWMAGTLPRAALQDYARQYYAHVRAFPGYIESALVHDHPPAARAILEENLSEEDGTRYGTSHPELWLRFAEGVGVDRAEVERTAPREAIRQVTRRFETFAKNSPAEALGSLFAYESQVPEIAESKLEGLRRHFDLHDERSLAFFEVHRVADVEHRESLRKLLDELPPEERRRARQAALLSAQALWDFLSEITREHAIA